LCVYAGLISLCARDGCGDYKNVTAVADRVSSVGSVSYATPAL